MCLHPVELLDGPRHLRACGDPVPGLTDFSTSYHVPRTAASSANRPKMIRSEILPHLVELLAEAAQGLRPLAQRTPGTCYPIDGVLETRGPFLPDDNRESGQVCR